MTACELGKQHRELGKSIHYNPFRHKGTVQDYTDWIDGWSETIKHSV